MVGWLEQVGREGQDSYILQLGWVVWLEGHPSKKLQQKLALTTILPANITAHLTVLIHAVYKRSLQRQKPQSHLSKGAEC